MKLKDQVDDVSTRWNQEQTTDGEPKTKATEEITVDDLLYDIENEDDHDLTNLTMLRVKDLRSLFGISRSKADELVAQESFPSFQPLGPNTAIYIPLEPLKKWINQQISTTSDESRGVVDQLTPPQGNDGN